MQISRRLSISIFVFSCAALMLYFYPNNMTETEHIHYHAGFLVYIDDKLQDYSGYQYMNYTPCTQHDEKKSLAEEQIEKAHLHENIGDVVHVHRSGAVWADLFKNIKSELPSDKKLVGYVNGKSVSEILTLPIEPYSSVVFAIGDTSASRSAEVVPRNHIEEVEKMSELCGS